MLAMARERGAEAALAKVLRCLDDNRDFMSQRVEHVKALIGKVVRAAYGEFGFHVELQGSIRCGTCCLPDSIIGLAIVVPSGQFRNEGDLVS